MFTAIIQGGGFTGQLGQLAEEEELYRTGFFGPDLGHLVGEDQAGYPLYLGVNPSFVAIPNNGVPFPMTKFLSVANLCGSVPDGNPVRDVVCPASVFVSDACGASMPRASGPSALGHTETGRWTRD
jgi:hypothetical protein